MKKKTANIIGIIAIVLLVGLLIVTNLTIDESNLTGQAVFTNTDCDDIYLESGYGMIAYWTLDDADLSGDDPLDVYGDNDGTNYGAQTGYGNAVVEEGFYFHANDYPYDYVEIPDSDALDIINGSTTIAAWIYPNSCTVGGFGTYPLIIGKLSHTYVFELDNSCKLRFYKSGLNNPGYYYSNGAIETEKWTHVVVVYNPDHEHDSGSGSIDFYVNGVLDASHGSVGGAGEQNSEGLGMGGSTSTSQNLDGYLDEVAIFNRNLTSQEIFTMYWESLADKHYCQVGDVGSGTEGDPYEISNCAQLQAMENNLSAYYELVNNIDCSETSTWNWDGAKYKGFEPIGNNTDRFSGGFDGNSYVISNLHINNIRYYKGLFGYIDSGVEISNVGLEDVDIAGRRYVGGLVGFNNNGLVENSYTTGSVSGNHHVGGLVGYTDIGVIDNCYSTASVSGVYENIGGLVGYAYSVATVEDSYATGSVSGGRYANNIGGLIGKAYPNPSIRRCYATGDVSGKHYMGGLIGYAYGCNINNTYATGDVSYGEYIGGLIGYLESGYLDNSYATGDVRGSIFGGGLVGNVYNGDIDHSFATGGVGGGNNYGDSTDYLGRLIGNMYYYELVDCHYLTNTGYGHTSLDCVGVEDGGDVDCTGHSTESYFYNIGNRPMGITEGYGITPIWDFTNVWDDIFDDSNYPPLRIEGLIGAAPSTDTGGTGGGADEEAEEEIIVLTLEEFEQGEYSDLGEGDEIVFDVTNPDTGSTETHRLRVVSIDLEKREVTIIISSDPITATLKLGESKRVDVNNDGKADVLVIFVSLINGKARIFTQDIVQKEVVEEPTPVPISEPEKPKQDYLGEEKEVGIGTYLLFVSLIALVVFIVVLLTIRKKKVHKEVRVRKMTPEEKRKRTLNVHKREKAQRAKAIKLGHLRKKRQEAQAARERVKARKNLELRKRRESKLRAEAIERGKAKKVRQARVKEEDKKYKEFVNRALRK